MAIDILRWVRCIKFNSAYVVLTIVSLSQETCNLVLLQFTFIKYWLLMWLDYCSKWLYIALHVTLGATHYQPSIALWWHLIFATSIFVWLCYISQRHECQSVMVPCVLVHYWHNTEPVWSYQWAQSVSDWTSLTPNAKLDMYTNQFQFCAWHFHFVLGMGGNSPSFLPGTLICTGAHSYKLLINEIVMNRNRLGSLGTLPFLQNSKASVIPLGYSDNDWPWQEMRFFTSNKRQWYF